MRAGLPRGAAEQFTMSRWQELVDDTLRTLESLDCPDRDRIDEAIWDAEKIAEMAELVPLGENPIERVRDFRRTLRQAVFDRSTSSHSNWSVALMLLDYPEFREHRS
jgi:hypothetical protein